MLQDILKTLKDAGIRLTPQRQEVLQALLESMDDGCRPRSAEEILRSVRRRYPGVSPDTVYRTLTIFQRLGLVREVNFRDGCRRFELVLGNEHHHHLVCLGCGYSKELPFCPADCLVRVQEYCPDFEIEDHNFTVYGYCEKCRRERRHVTRETVGV
ncbi:MAG: Fur family transcriptional regulator [Thermacetogeniaceae bacterium]